MVIKKNSFSFLVFLFLIFGSVLAENEAGVRLALHEKTILGLLKWASPSISQIVQKVTVPDISTSVQSGIIKINILLQNIEFGIQNFDADSIAVDFQESDIVDIKISNLKGSGFVLGKFNIGVIYDSENIDVTVNSVNCHISIQMKTRENQGKFYPDVFWKLFDMDIDLDFTLSGSTISGFINLIKPVIKNALINSIINTIEPQVMELVKQQLEALPLYYPIGETGLSVDYSILGTPKIINDTLILSSYGSLVNTNISETLKPPFELPTNLPEYDQEGKQVQLFVSDYSLNTILYTLYKSNLISFYIKPEDVPESVPVKLTTPWLKMVIWGLEKVYGDKECELSIKALKNPEIKFGETFIKSTIPLEMVLNVRITNETTNETSLDQAIKINTEIVLDFDFHLVEEGHITTNVHQMKILNTTVVESKVPDAHPKIITDAFNLLTNVFIPILNKFFLKSFSISIPEVEGIILTDSTITHKENFVLFEITLNFAEKTKHTTKRVPAEKASELELTCKEGKIVSKARLLQDKRGLVYYRYNCVNKDYKIAKSKRSKGINYKCPNAQ